MATDIDPGDPSQHDLWLVNITTKVYYLFFCRGSLASISRCYYQCYIVDYSSASPAVITSSIESISMHGGK